MKTSKNLYRKKPIVIEARQLSEENCIEIAEWVLGRPVIDNPLERLIVRIQGGLKISTLEGNTLVNLGDFIIKGINGEFYPCKLDIFEKTYEKALKDPLEIRERSVDQLSEYHTTSETIESIKKNRKMSSVYTMDFGEALIHAKAGEKIARTGWNGKNMWVAMTPGKILDLEKHDIWPEHIKNVAVNNGGKVEILPYLTMKTVDNKVVIGWLASQTDMLADDWYIV
jgi:hypothetical protein